MGAERQDTDPTLKRVGAEPGLGKPPVDRAAHVAAPADEAPPPVDFDALHAALGDPLDYEEMPSGPAIERSAEAISESLGRSNASYSSARPRTIPPTRAPAEDPNAPAVIIADADATPAIPPQSTVPFGLAVPSPPFPAAPPPPGAPGAPGSHPNVAVAPAARQTVPSNAAARHAPPPPPIESGPALYPTPHAPTHARGVPQMTVRMLERPLNPRRSNTPTLVLRPQGPMAKQRLIAFMAMLLLVTSCGIAAIIWRKPQWIGLGSASPAITTPPEVLTAVPAGTVTPSVAPSAGAAAASAATVAPTSSGPTLAPVTPRSVTPSATVSPPPRRRPTSTAPRPSPSLPPASRL